MRAGAAMWLSLCLMSACTTYYQDEQRDLYWQYRSGHLTEEQYQQRLSEIRDEQPWGGVGGAKEEPPASFLYSK